MSGGKSIVRDLYVSVPRMDASSSSSSPTGSTAYVFAVRPRGPSQQTRNRRRRGASRHRGSMIELSPPTLTSPTPRTRDRRNSLPSSFIAVEGQHHLESSIGYSLFVHEVSKTYSQCRLLYQRLCAFTDCTNMATCCCILGACPFWSMHAVLKQFPFPRKTLTILSLHWSQQAKQTHRMHAFHGLMKAIFDHFQFYRDDYFLDRVSATEYHGGCKVLVALEQFLGITDDVVDKMKAAEQRMQLKMNLRGWQSDRKKLELLL